LVFANAVDSKTFDAGRSTSGNNAALSTCRLSIAASAI
jgi:hypothetical protein